MQKYNNPTKVATATTNQGLPTFSLWPKIASSNGPNNKPTAIVTLKQLYDLITGAKLQAITEQYQKRLDAEGKTNKLRVWAARSLYGFLPGKYDGKGAGYLAEFSPWVVGDIDGIRDENELRFIVDDLMALPFIALVYVSKSGRGVRFVVPTNATLANWSANEIEVLKAVSERLKLSINGNKKEPHVDTENNGKSVPWMLNYSPPELTFFNSEASVFQCPSGLKIKGEENKKEVLPLGRNQQSFDRSSFSDEDHQYITEYLIRRIEQEGRDITSGMSREQWLSLGASLATQYGQDVGFDYFHRLSNRYPTYNEAAARKLITEQARKRKGTIHHFYKICKEYGYTYRDAIREKWNRERTNKSTRPQVEASPSGWTLKVIPPNELVERDMNSPSGFTIANNSYEFPTGKRGDLAPVSNFTISSLYLLKDPERSKRVLRLENKLGEVSVICCHAKAMTSNNEFAAIAEGQGNFVSYWSRVQFAAIKEHIFHYEEVAEEINVLGYQPETGYYAFANGIFDGSAFYKVNDYGVVAIKGKQFYLPAFSKVNEDAAQAYHNERKFVFQPGNCDFKSWSSQLVKVFGNNAKVGICFTVAAIFRDVVFSRVNCFPLLFLFGPKGTGKTTFRNALHRLFGDYGPNDAIGLGSASSTKGMSRKLAQVRNALSTLEEYKNSIGSAKIEGLKNYYDGIGYERAQTSNDNRTHATHVNSAIIVGGQEMPTKENALFSRVLMLTFGQTKFSDAEKKAFAELENMIGNGMGNVLLEIASHRKLVEQSFFTEYNRIYSDLRKDPVTSSLEERTLTNVSAVLAPLKALANVLQFPFDYQEVYQVLSEQIKTQQLILDKTNEVNLFWQVFDSLDGGRITEGEQYGYKDNILYVYLRGMYQIYSESARQQGLNPLPQSTLEQYLKLQPYFVDLGLGKNRIYLETNRGFDKRRQFRCLTFDSTQMQNIGLNFLDNRKLKAVSNQVVYT